jgi:PAS domain S-box-containing protein
MPTHQTPEHLRWNAEEQYRLLMENVKDYAIFLLDTEGRIITWSTGAERILGYKEAEIIGQPFARVFIPEDAEQGQPEHELKVAREKGRAEDERWHIRKDGTRFWASGIVTPLWDGGGTLIGFAKILRDITERKRAEEELADANRRKDEFLAMLGHELRNPLAPVLNGLHIIEREGRDNPTIQQTVGMMDRQLRRIVRMVDDLLDVSRVTKGKIQLRRKREQLSTLVAYAVETIRPLLDSRRHQLSVALPPEAIWLDVDAARIEQALANLLSNAAKYTEPGGRIWLTVEQEGDRAIIRVKDTGVGIRPDMLNRVFDLFVQADRTLDRALGGLGIGLTLVRKLVEMHGGTVEAFSEGIGKGSEFIVRLPTVPEVKELPPEARPEKAKREEAHCRVLIVDDNVDTAESLAMLLRFYGHEVWAAHTGPKALEVARAEQPDVVLLDIGLPGMDGYEVARLLRQQEELGDMRLVAMTGYGQEKDRQRSDATGFDYHLVKPVDPAKLQDLLAEL